MPKLYDKHAPNFAPRARLALVVVGVCFAAIVVRLWYLQILKGEHFRSRSENNRIRMVYVPPPRGVITARGGEVLVKNRPAFNVELIMEDAPSPKQTLGSLAKVIGEPEDEVVNAIRDQRSRRRFEPKLIRKDISRDLVGVVAAHRHALPGVVINVVPARHYVFGDVAAHLLGYIREISRDQLERQAYTGYRQGDLVGQYGLEARWERLLKGERGVQAVVVNAAGTRIGEASYEPEAAGSEMTLTVDYSTQVAADAALQGVKGAIVALNPKTGAVLALSSSPRFDPNMFIREIPPEQWRELVMGRERRLNNRAVQGTFPPGSTFKIIVGAAGLAEGVITPEERVFCKGAFPFGGRSYRCHKREGHGSVNFAEAMAQSCDVYYYTLGQRLGVDRIHDYARRFGLGEITGLGLVEEPKGTIPSTEWKRTYFKNPEDKRWYPGETLSVAIGQGAVTVTPLQLARAVAALVNGGRVVTPYVVERIVSADGRIVQYEGQPAEVSRLDIDERALRMVRKSLVDVVTSTVGTGRRASLTKEFGITVAGKTGTSQVVSLELSAKGEHLQDHAWFVSYAPAENPEIVVAVLVENGGHGGAAAAPRAKQVLEAYFSGRGVPRLTPAPAASSAKLESGEVSSVD